MPNPIYVLLSTEEVKKIQEIGSKEERKCCCIFLRKKVLFVYAKKFSFKCVYEKRKFSNDYQKRAKTNCKSECLKRCSDLSSC